MTTRPAPRCQPHGDRHDPGLADDTGSMPMAMLLALVGITLSALLTSLAVTQLVSTRQATARTQALHAAQAGLDAALGHLRAVNRIDGYGDRSTLPCTVTGTVTAAGTTAATGSYSATVTYHTVDDQPLSCPPAAVPAYARIRSQGVAPADAGRRTLQARYTFATTNANTNGGPIRVFRAKGQAGSFCLDANTGAAGDVLKIESCDPFGSLLQTFAYTADLTVQLAKSESDAYPNGLCVDAGAAPSVGGPVTLEQCSEALVDRQRWSFNTNANFEATSTVNGRPQANGLCWRAKNPGMSGHSVILGSAAEGICRRDWDNVATFSPDHRVGAGAAGPATGQLVNFAQFGRCLDAPLRALEGTNTRPPYLIAWPCKQAPDIADIDWNQRWAMGSDGRLTATNPPPPAGGAQDQYDPDGPYCVKSPNSTAPGQYVDVVPCPDSLPAELKWTMVRQADSWAASYVVKDYWGRCLSPEATPAEPSDESGYSISRVAVAVCDGTALQKWNAPPDAQATRGLEDFQED